jgi:7-cyano-7-deazaguanine synthase
LRADKVSGSEVMMAGSIAVLVSGGLDSAILLAEMRLTLSTVHPLYLRGGLLWEGVELHHLRRFLDAIQSPEVQPLHVLELPLRDLYGAHWSLTGRDVPDGSSPDEAVFLPGRNVLLLSKAMLWCHLKDVPAIALATLRSNPFPDATPEFFETYEAVVNRAISGSVQVVRPYETLAKTEVMSRGRDLPLGLTFSCIQPIEGRHCGRCNKCAERRHAFRDAEMADPTEYQQDHGTRS